VTLCLLVAMLAVPGVAPPMHTVPGYAVRSVGAR
jgi:hypothetical protein